MKTRKILSSGKTLGKIKFFSGNAQGLKQTLLRKDSKSLHFASAHTITSCLNDDLLASDLFRNVVIADSTYLASVVGYFESGVQNIRGVDFFREFLSNPIEEIRNYFVVADELSAAKLETYLANNHKEIVVAGIFVPSVNSDWRVLYSEIVCDIVNKEVDLIWVGVGSPKQDSISANLAREMNINSIAIGAAIKFLTGEVEEAPKILRNFKLEWLHRISQDPKRLAQRYLRDFFPFLLCLLSFTVLKFRERIMEIWSLILTKIRN